MTYPRRTNKPRPKLRDVMIGNQKAMDQYALIMGVPKVSLGDIPDAKAPRVKSDIPTEHIEQVHFVNWFERTFPTVRIFAIPNGGGRGEFEARRLIDEGVRSGVPDLYVPAWSLWVEMKRKEKYSTSEDQHIWHAYLRELGDTVILGIGCEDAKRKIMELLS